MVNIIETFTSSSPLPALEEIEPFLNLSMGERRKVLMGCAAKGWVYLVGSLPNIPDGFAKGQGLDYARNVFNGIILPQAENTGVATVFQKAGTVIPGIGMNQEPYYHPDVGLGINENENIVILPGTTVKDIVEEVAGGLDFHPNALPGWQVILENAGFLREIGTQVLKTQLTSTNCARFHLSPEVGMIQDSIMSSLAVTHLSKAAQLAPVIVVSLDNPNADVLEGLKHDLEVMLGMSWDDDGNLTDQGLLEAFNIVPALHSCEMYEMLQAMKLGVGLVHGDFAKFQAKNLLRGDASILKQFIEDNGLIGIGIIPQSGDSIERLAMEMNINMDSGKDGHDLAVGDLRKQHQQVVENLLIKYQAAVDYIAEATGMEKSRITEHCLLSYTCGFGGTKSTEVARYALELADELSNKIRRANRN